MPLSLTQLACTVKVCFGFFRERNLALAKSSCCRVPLALSLASCALNFFTALTARQESKTAPTSTSRGAHLCQDGSVGRKMARIFVLTADGASSLDRSSTVWL